jgi:hypothetical protein
MFVPSKNVFAALVKLGQTKICPAADDMNNFREIIYERYLLAAS